MSERWTEGRVFECLHKVFPSGAFALLPQVRNGTGYARGTTRTADAIAVSCWPSRGLYLAGVEIKVTMHDWRKELAEASKAEAIAQYCKYWYLAAPEGLVPIGEVPEKWGLIECSATGGAKIVKAASEHDAKPIDMLLLCSILRVAADATVPKQEVAGKIRAEVEEKLKVATRQADREREQLLEYIRVFEEASGVNIRTWSGKRIGETVKLVMAQEGISPERRLQSVAQTCRDILAMVDEALQPDTGSAEGKHEQVQGG